MPKKFAYMITHDVEAEPSKYDVDDKILREYIYMNVEAFNKAVREEFFNFLSARFKFDARVLDADDIEEMKETDEEDGTDIWTYSFDTDVDGEAVHVKEVCFMSVRIELKE